MYPESLVKSETLVGTTAEIVLLLIVILEPCVKTFCLDDSKLDIDELIGVNNPDISVLV